MDTGRDLVACWKDTDLEQEWRCPPVVKASLRQQESQTTQWWKSDQTLPTDQQGVAVLGAPLGQDRGTLSSVPQDSCWARSPVRMASAVVLCCHAGQLFPSGGATSLVRAISLLLTMRTCGIASRSSWISKGL